MTGVQQQTDLAQSILDGTVGAKKLNGADFIVQTAHAVENLSKEDAYRHLARMRDAKDYCVFAIGGILCVIRTHEWHCDEGYSTFGEFVQERFGIARSTAQYY